MIDCNVSLSRWPFRRLPDDQTPQLISRLRRYGIQRAFASSFDGLLHKDVAAVNDRLAIECRERGEGILIPFGVVNPMLPDWEEDLRRCRDVHNMRGVRIFPGYHGYSLESEAFGSLLKQCSQLGLIVQLPVLLEDPRTQHPLAQVPELDLRALARRLEEAPGTRLVILNYRPGGNGFDLLRSLMTAGRVYADMSNVEAAGGVRLLLEKVPQERVLFGSHAPFFAYESALLKIQESGLTDQQRQAVLSRNSQSLLEAPA